MDERSRFTLMQGIKSGSFSERQAFNALQAIKSDASNGEVADLIGSLAFSSLSKGKDLSEMVDDKLGRDREMFDYQSGADGKLRALMSFGETEGDREAILKKTVGEDGYV